MRSNVFAHYFEALSRGDPVALAATGVFLAFLVVIALVAWRYKVEERRHEEEKRRRWYGK
jgi:hypothetical protein